MKKLIIISAFIITILNTQACQNNNGSGSTTNKSIKKEAKYYCTMHPSVTFDKPGACPKCGMKLVERDTADKK